MSRPISDPMEKPEFSVKEETLKSRVAAILPVEEIRFSSTHAYLSGKGSFNTFNVEIVSNTSLPNSNSFPELAIDIKGAVADGISHLEDY